MKREVLAGFAIGYLLARIRHLVKAMEWNANFSRCAWCGGHRVDLRTPDAQGRMLAHIARCSKRPREAAE